MKRKNEHWQIDDRNTRLTLGWLRRSGRLPGVFLVAVMIMTAGCDCCEDTTEQSAAAGGNSGSTVAGFGGASASGGGYQGGGGTGTGGDPCADQDGDGETAVYCGGSDCDDSDPSWQTWAPATVATVLVDDYRPSAPSWGQWDYSRIGTDRGEMGAGDYTVMLGSGVAAVQVANGWGGVWTSLLHTGASGDALDPKRLLGPIVKDSHQVALTGVEIDVEGSGTLKVELLGLNNNTLFAQTASLSPNDGVVTLSFPVTITTPVKLLNWLVDGSGNATVHAVRLTVSPAQTLSVAEAAFLFSYGHLSQSYDPATHLVSDRARWPAGDFSAVQATGMYALVTAVAADLGYVDNAAAQLIIADIRDALVSLPVHPTSGLLPHFVANGQLAPNTEWSSIDTVIALLSASLACDIAGVNRAPLDTITTAVDWMGLTAGLTLPMSHGNSYNGTLLASRWDAHGAEAFLAALAVAAIHRVVTPLTYVDTIVPKTWDGAGFNTELAGLFYPMLGADAWGVDWALFRTDDTAAQLSYFNGTAYAQVHAFGLSACEVPEPWALPESSTYGAWGLGGFNGMPNDGSSVVGYPVVCPHYAAMIAAEQPRAFEAFFGYLMDNGLFTPINNVESMGIDASNTLRHNSLKGSWNLSMQALSVARAIGKCNNRSYGPHAAATANPLWGGGYAEVMP